MNDSLFPTPSVGPAEWLTAHCDGGSRGNPGPSGYGAVVEDSKGRVLAELSEFVGIQTNNFAEYSGLLAVLKWATQNGTKYLRVISDSELMVKQMQGKYAVKSPILKPLYEEARKLSRRLEGFEMRHTLRGGNKHADRLANEAMDRGMGKQGSGVSEQGSGGGWSALPKVGKPADFEAARQQANTPTSQPGAPGPDFRTWETTSPKHEARPAAPAPPPAVKPVRQILEGYVKDGVVHLLGGELPDGIFVKIIRE
ncbi:MAG: ribonuclease HI family protein [Terracidiphilus sp.]